MCKDVHGIGKQSNQRRSLPNSITNYPNPGGRTPQRCSRTTLGPEGPA